jgi:hypothetical protein
MNDRKARELFVLLHETAGSAGIEIIEDRLNRRGGVCRVDGRVHVIFDEQAPYREKNRLILEAITRTDYDAAYLPPKVRDLITGGGVMVDMTEDAEAERSPEEGLSKTRG